MKKASTLITALSLCILCMAQTPSWKQLNEFHSLVNKVLHPVMMGNIKPVKDSSAVLLAKASEWQISKVPEDVNKSIFKVHVAELVAKCTALNDAVKAHKPDTELVTLANEVHKNFHALLSACNLKD